MREARSIEQIRIKGKKFYEQCASGIIPTDPKVHCTICGKHLMEFTSPMTGSIVVLRCECERHLDMQKKFYAEYRLCEQKRGAQSNSYSDFIDGMVNPKGEDEEKIKRIGQDTRQHIRETEAIIARRKHEELHGAKA